MTKQTELVIYDQNKFVEIFTEKTGDSFIEKLEKEVAEFQKTSDISSEKGRNAIKSYAHELSKHKAPLKAGKLQLTEEVRITLSKLNEEENRLRDKIQELQDEVRKPLTDFEDKEKRRIEVRQARIIALENASYVTSTIQAVLTPIEFYKKVLISLEDLLKFDWQEFDFKAETTYNNSKIEVEKKLKKEMEQELEKQELEKLRKEKEEREKKEREEQIIKETEENIRRVEREKAQKVAKEAEEQRYRLEAEKKAAEQAKINAEIRVKQAAKIAKAQREQAEIQAKKDKEEAIRLERARAEAERQKQIDEEKARAENLEHKTKIYKDIVAALLPYVNNNMEATAKTKAIIAGIAKGKIPYISIKF